MEIAVLSVLILFPIGLYAAFARGGRRAWGLMPAGREEVGAGAYRSASRARWVKGSAPPVVRIAALTCFFLGQMIFPGALAALVGFVAFAEMMGSGRSNALFTIDLLSAPTGLIVAARMLSAGAAMLDRAKTAAVKARAASDWAICHNLVLLTAIVIAAACGAIEGDEGWAAAGICAYCGVSIAHGLLVRRAAAALKAYDARQAEAAFA